MSGSIGSHITFDSADVELHVAAYKLAPALIVQNWALCGLRHHSRVKIKAVRIIGTCAICGTEGAVSACEDCDRDVAPPCLVERNGKSFCVDCAA